MTKRLVGRKNLVTVLLILLAAAAVSFTMLTENRAQAQWCDDPCDPYCWGT